MSTDKLTRNECLKKTSDNVGLYHKIEKVFYLVWWPGGRRPSKDRICPTGDRIRPFGYRFRPSGRENIEPRSNINIRF